MLAVSFALPQGQALASVYNGTVVFSCTGANASGTGSHVLDRDNTGAGQERLRVDIFDGAGTLIYTFTYQNLLGIYGGGIGNFTYTNPPQYNPITFVLTSLAGNNLPQQVDVTAQGQCAGLPTFAPPFSGPGLPRVRDLVLMTSDAAVLDAPGGNPTGRVIRTCQTAFVLETSGNYARVFVMGGWIPVNSFVVVDPTTASLEGRPSRRDAWVGNPPHADLDLYICIISYACAGPDHTGLAPFVWRLRRAPRAPSPDSRSVVPWAVC